MDGDEGGGYWIELPGTGDVTVGFACPPEFTPDGFRAMLGLPGSR